MLTVAERRYLGFSNFLDAIDKLQAKSGPR